MIFVYAKWKWNEQQQQKFWEKLWSIVFWSGSGIRYHYPRLSSLTNNSKYCYWRDGWSQITLDCKFRTENSVAEPFEKFEAILKKERPLESPGFPEGWRYRVTVTFYTKMNACCRRKAKWLCLWMKCVAVDHLFRIRQVKFMEKV